MCREVSVKFIECNAAVHVSRYDKYLQYFWRASNSDRQRQSISRLNDQSPPIYTESFAGPMLLRQYFSSSGSHTRLALWVITLRAGSLWATGGKPSTLFPPGWLAEQACLNHQQMIGVPDQCEIDPAHAHKLHSKWQDNCYKKSILCGCNGSQNLKENNT